MEYTIIGDDMQALKLQLQPGEEIYAEAGAMLFMSEGIQLDSQMKGGILGGLARKFLAGESLFMSVFRANQPAELALAAPSMGKIFAVELKGDTLLAERNAYLCSIGNVELSVAFTRKLGAGLFGGEGFILQKISGQGLVFLHAGGTMMQFELKPGERLRVDTGCIVSMASTVSYDIQYVGGIKNALFGGEGLFFATLQGPGHVTLQTLPFSRLADRIKMAMGSNQGESRGPAGLNVLGDLISGKK